MTQREIYEAQGAQIKALNTVHYKNLSTIDAVALHHCYLKEMLQELGSFGQNLNFYPDINYAFKLYIEKYPNDAKKILDTYQQLQGLFIAIKSNTATIDIQRDISG